MIWHMIVCSTMIHVHMPAKSLLYKLTEKMNEVIQALKRKNDEETLDESDEPKKAKIEVEDLKAG